MNKSRHGIVREQKSNLNGILLLVGRYSFREIGLYLLCGMRNKIKCFYSLISNSTHSGNVIVMWSAKMDNNNNVYYQAVMCGTK